MTNLTLKNLLNSSSSGLKKGQIFQLFAFHQETGEVIGSVQCSLIQRFDVQKAYLGYGVLNNHWRQGFGFEIADGMIDHAFQELKLHRLEAEILPSNIVSIQLSKKLGMTSEGIRRKSVYVDGEWQDHEVFAIIAEDRSILDMKPNKSLI